MHRLTLIRYKLPAVFLAFSIAICVVLGVSAQVSVSRTTSHEIQVTMLGLIENKHQQLQDWFTNIERDIQITASNPFVATSLRDGTTAYAELGTGAERQLQRAYIHENPHPTGEKQKKTSSKEDWAYNDFHRGAHPYFRQLVDIKGYYDVFLIDPSGTIVYTVFKELDYATNLVGGQYADSGLAEVFNEAMTLAQGELAFRSFEAYAPSAMAPASFIATPVFDDTGRRIGVLAFQMPVNHLNAVLQAPAWMGPRAKVMLVDDQNRLNSQYLVDEPQFGLLDTLPRTNALSAAPSAQAQFVSAHPGVEGETVVTAMTQIQFLGASWRLLAEGNHEHLFASVSRMRLIMTALSLTLAAAMAVIGYFFAQSLSRPIDDLRLRMQTMADGDLHADIPAAQRRDELGQIAGTLAQFRDKLVIAREQENAQLESARVQGEVVDAVSTALTKLREGDLSYSLSDAFPEEYERLRIDYNKSMESLNHALAQVVEAADSIRRGSLEISQSADDLSNRTENQAATLEQTAAALDQLTASVRSAAEGAKSVEAIVSEARDEASQSGQVVRTAVDAMHEIEQSSDQISRIIGVIDDIAFQTNLLALNAGVEAARAGESGKGFSVVASEVRALAQRSSEAAHEIKALISGSSHQVERGVDLVGKAGGALESIVARVENIAALVSDIASSASEQSAGLNEINIGVNQLDQVTQQNAAMVEETTAASHMLQKDTSVLSDLVAGFSIKVSGADLDHVPEDEDDTQYDSRPDKVHDQTISVPVTPLAATGTDAQGWQDF